MTGRPPNADCHNSCDRIATGGPPRPGREDIASVSPGAKNPPLLGVHAEGREEMIVHERGPHAHGTIAGGEIDRAGPPPRAASGHAVADGERADIGKRSRHLAELEVLGRRQPEPLERAGGRVRGEAHQLLRRRIRERPEDRVSEDREDRGVGADTQTPGSAARRR